MTKSWLAALAAACVAATTSGAAAQTEIVFNTFGGHQHILHTGLAGPWAQGVEQATAGRVKVKFPANSLAPPPDQFDMVEQQVADAAYMFHGFLTKRVPLVQIAHLPLIYTNPEAHAVAMWRTYKQFFEVKDPYKGVVLLGFAAGTGADVFSLKDPIVSVDSLRNAKVWSTPAAAKQMTVLGASLVTTPAVRMFEIVSKGTVDAYVSISVGEAHAFKVAQFARSATLIPGKMLAPTFSFFINPKKWAAIPERDRTLILGASGEKLARLTRNWDEKEKNAEADFKAMGKEIIVAPPKFAADLEKAWRPLHDEWIAEANKLGVDGKAALAYFLAQANAVAAERK